MDASYYRDLIAENYRRRWIITVDVLTAATDGVAWLRSIGAPRPFVIAGSLGHGDLPSPESSEWAILNTGGSGVMGSIRAFAGALAALPGGVVDRIDRWDPDRSAAVLGGYLASHTHVAGRPLYGARRPEWEALEDKTTVDAIWRAADVPMAPFEIVPSRREKLAAAADRLDRGAGTVWVADNKEGFHGGGEYLRWVTDDVSRAEAVQFMETRSDFCRVMPFLSGVACSIHGVVFDDFVMALRPVESISLRDETGRLRYAGMSSFWDAPEDGAAEMSAVAKRVGAHLSDLVDYRGIFTIDGVLGAEGFRPTELNPRPGAGIGPASAGVADVSLVGLGRAIIEREPLDFRPAELERLVLDGWSRRRAGGGHMTIGRVPEVALEQPVEFHGDVCSATAREGSACALQWRRGPYGGLLKLVVDSAAIEFGPPMAPKTVSAFALADELWDVGVGPLFPVFDL